MDKIYYDILKLISNHLLDQRDRVAVSLTCKLWYRVIQDSIPEYVRNDDSSFCFKITKPRFLIAIELTDKHKSFYAIISNRNNNLNYYLSLHEVKRDDKFVVYESDKQILSCKFRGFDWSIHYKTFGTRLFRGYQTRYGDLCYQHFATGLKYREGDELVIGSYYEGSYICCCAISLLPH